MRLFSLFLLLLSAPLMAVDPNRGVREALQAELEDWSAPGWEARSAAQGPSLDRYREQLALVAGGPLPGTHRAGWIPFVYGGRTERLGVNVFRPEGRTVGTLLFVHGYLSHSANFAYTFARFLRLGWMVITLDLPGHGLSTGARGDVDTFYEYGDAVGRWLNWAAPLETGRVLLLAHSLGTTAVFDALRRGLAPVPSMVFCAPLLRPDWYPALVVGEVGLGWAFRNFPSSFGWDGYLDGYDMPTHWFTALKDWLGNLPGQKALNWDLTIYSGDNDTVVDEPWIRGEYKRLVPGARYVLLPGQGHLFLSQRSDRAAFHDRLAADLGLTPLPPPD